MSNYPEMSTTELDKAPWNQEDTPEEEVEVTVSVTYSKTVKIKVNDYDYYDEVDDEGNTQRIYDFSNCNLKEAVKSQIDTVHDLSTWNEDDFEVIFENPC